MNENFECQKERLLAIKQEISLLYQQVNYLLRNEKPLELLDLDVLMNRTHTLYDLLCAINVGDESLEEDLPLDADALAGLFGGVTQETPEDEPVEEPKPEEEEAPVEETPEVSLEAPRPEPEEEVPVEEKELKEEPIVEQPVEEEPRFVEEVPTETKVEENPDSDEYGLFFRFEDAPEEEEEKEDTVEQGGKVVHVVEEIPEEEIPERDRVYGEDLVKDNPLVMPRVDEEWAAERDEIERESSEVVSDVFGRDDAEFELSTGETLGERMMGEDNSLAAKLQQNPVRDLKTVIGINEKFLFVNELFGGSMEKYNQAIENLNDLKTLNGAIIYLNELKIELQWNSSNEAYQKLKELVNRKFE